MTGTAGADGTSLPSSEHRHSRVQLFRFSAATWNSHRIHYDVEFARGEGHRDVVVHSTLLGEVLARRCVEAVGTGASLLSVQWRNEATVVADETLRWEGEIVASDPDPEAPGCERIEVRCRIIGDDGGAAVTGSVHVRRPRTGSSAQTRRS